MSQPATLDSAAVTRASLNYIVDNGIKPVNETYGPGPVGLMRKTTGMFEAHAVAIADARPHRAGHSLDTSGFLLADHPTRMANFLDADELARVYYPEMQALIAAHSGARRVHIFDHTIRSGDADARETLKLREPVKSVHNDYTEWSGPQRVRDILPEEAEALIQNRFAIIQVWRAINEPIARDPLCIADARSLAPGDFIAAERRFPTRVGEIYQFAYNPAHRWHWFPHMHRDEALIFKVYDSAKDGRARWGAHTSFDDPAASATAHPRESIEIRAFAFF
jgi:hypothetical protein